MSKHHKPPHKGHPSSGFNPAAQKGSPRVMEVNTEHHELRRPGTQPDSQVIGSSQWREQPKGMPKFRETSPTSIPLQEKPVEELSSGYVSIDLPSQFQFYEFKTLAIRTLKAVDQAKLHQAATQKRIRYTVEAISATLGNGISAFDLTPQDFYYLMYWQQVNSFLKYPRVVTAHCTDAQHNEDVLLGKWNEDLKKRVPLDENTLQMKVTVNKTTLETKNLEYKLSDFRWPSIEHLDLHVETMRDIVDAAENLTELENLDEIEWLAGYAAFLRRRDPEDTLIKRMERIRDLTADQVSDLDEYILATTSYGVSESTKIKCMECGALNEVVIPFDAHTFLPQFKRR